MGAWGNFVFFGREVGSGRRVSINVEWKGWGGENVRQNTPGKKNVQKKNNEK